jgi:hypothetical protein
MLDPTSVSFAIVKKSNASLCLNSATSAGMVTCVRLEQYANAHSPTAS